MLRVQSGQEQASVCDVCISGCARLTLTCAISGRPRAYQRAHIFRESRARARDKNIFLAKNVRAHAIFYLFFFIPKR